MHYFLTLEATRHLSEANPCQSFLKAFIVLVEERPSAPEPGGRSRVRGFDRRNSSSRGRSHNQQGVRFTGQVHARHPHPRDQARCGELIKRKPRRACVKKLRRVSIEAVLPLDIVTTRIETAPENGQSETFPQLSNPCLPVVMTERSPSITLLERCKARKGKCRGGDAEPPTASRSGAEALRIQRFRCFQTCHLLAGKADFVDEIRKLPYPEGHLKSK